MTTLGQTESTLLLLLMIFEKERTFDLLKHLVPEEAKQLSEYARTLMELPENQRLQQLTSGIKAHVYHQAFSGLPFDDVPRLLMVLKDELPATIGVVLRYLPERVALEVREQLPPEIAQEIPPPESMERVSEDVIQALRHEFQQIYFRDLYADGL